MSERVLLVGTGLIGGSVGMALREAGGCHVAAYDADRAAATLAVDLGAADEACTDLAAATAVADVVVVATPVGQILPSVRAVAASARPGVVVTDVGSTKAQLVAEAERVLGPGRAFVGGHPMAGSEREGVEAARPDLFRDALWILTPTDHTDPAAFRRVNALVSRTGARVLALDPEEHDRLVALVSHLPYGIATTLMDLAGEERDERVFLAAAGSFRDVTRTAGSSPRIWRDILSSNRTAVLKEVDAFAAKLGAFRDALAAQDWDAVDAIVERAREAKRRLPLKGERGPAKPLVLEVPIPDRTGVLAEITTAVGVVGVNIEDLHMEHFPSGGLAALTVDGADAAARAADALRARGYRVTILDEA